MMFRQLEWTSALEWTDGDGYGGTCTGTGPFGCEYGVWMDAYGAWNGYYNHDTDICVSDLESEDTSLEAAKAACQAHMEKVLREWGKGTE